MRGTPLHLYAPLLMRILSATETDQCNNRLLVEQYKSLLSYLGKHETMKIVSSNSKGNMG